MPSFGFYQPEAGASVDWLMGEAARYQVVLYWKRKMASQRGEVHETIYSLSLVAYQYVIFNDTPYVNIAILEPMR